MLFIRFILLATCLHLTVNQSGLASTIIASNPNEIEISRDFLIGKDNPEPNLKKTLHLGYFSGEKWIKITLSNPSTETLNKFIYFDALTGAITQYENQISRHQLIKLRDAGSSVPYLKRNPQSVFAIFPITLEPTSEKEYLFQITSRHNFNSKIYLGNLNDIRNREEQKLGFIDFYIGGICCLILYNFFIFFFLKDINYLNYCFFSGSFLMVILNIHGSLDKIFMTEHFSYSHYLICFSAFALMNSLLFTFSFLEIKKLLPKVKVIYKIIFILTFFIFIIGLTSIEDRFQVLFGHAIDCLVLLTNIFFIFCSIKLIKISNPARFYLISWLVVFISLIIWFGMTFGILANNFFTQHALLYANLGQMLTLSLALAFRILKLTKEKQIAEEEALQKNRYQRLVRVLSHDIGNSLTIVNSYSKKLIKPKNLEPSIQRIVEKIYFAAENIKNILNHVREEELLTTRKNHLELHPTNLAETLNTSLIVFEEHLRFKNIELKIDIPSDIYIMAIPTSFLNNIVNNIISNSIKFSYENSSIEISAKIENNLVIMIFKDYGKGIKIELLNKIFFSNHILSTEGTQSEVGYGFGTTLLREYVELFGGKLNVESLVADASSQYSGTTIRLDFPLPSNSLQ